MTKGMPVLELKLHSLLEAIIYQDVTRELPNLK